MIAGLLFQKEMIEIPSASGHVIRRLQQISIKKKKRDFKRPREWRSGFLIMKEQEKGKMIRAARETEHADTDISLHGQTLCCLPVEGNMGEEGGGVFAELFQNPDSCFSLLLCQIRQMGQRRTSPDNHPPLTMPDRELFLLIRYDRLSQLCLQALTSPELTALLELQLQKFGNFC